MRKKMKKTLLILLVFVFLIACKTAKISEPVIVYKTQIDTFKINTTTIEKETITLPIDDKMIIAINEAKDSICDEQIDKVLAQINFIKTSGDNEYSILYNKNKKQIEIIAKMRELLTKNKTSSSDKEAIKYQYKEIPVEVPIYTNILALWQKILIGLGVLFPLFHIIRLIIKLKS